jgi:hypothetical protein
MSAQEVQTEVQPEGVVLEGRTVRLTPVSGHTEQEYLNNLSALYDWEMHGPHADRWRWRGQEFEPVEWRAMLESNLHTLFFVDRVKPRLIAVRRDQKIELSGLGPERVGMVRSYDASDADHDGVVSLEVGRFADDREGLSVAMISAVGLMMHNLFCARYRKVYMEVAGYNLDQFGRGADRLGIWKEEARLRDHLSYAGRLWDLHTFAVYREDWLRHDKIQRMLARELRVA